MYCKGMKYVIYCSSGVGGMKKFYLLVMKSACNTC